MAQTPKADPNWQRSMRLPTSLWAELDKEAARTNQTVSAVIKRRLTGPNGAALLPPPAGANDEADALLNKPLTIRLGATHREALAKIRKTFGYRNNAEAVQMLVLRLAERIDEGQTAEPSLPAPRRTPGVVTLPQTRMRPIAEIEAEKNRRLALARLFAPKSRPKP